MLLGAVLAVSSTTWAVSGSVEPYGSEKLESIRPLSVNLVERYGATAFEESTSRAACLYGLHVDSSSTSPVIELHLSDAPLLAMTKSDNSIVFELANTIVLNDLERMMIDGGHLVEDVTVEQSGVSPHFSARLTVRTNEAFSAKVTRIGDHLRLTITAPDSALDTALAEQMDAQSAEFARSVAGEYRARRSNSIDTVTDAFADVMAKLDQANESAKLKLLQAELAGGVSDTKTLDGLIAAAETEYETLQREFERHQMMLTQASAGSVESVVKRVDDALQAMNSLRLSAAQQLESSTMIRAQVAQISPTPSQGTDLNAFDRALSEVRTASHSNNASDNLTAFDVALETVGDAMPALPVDSVETAALRVNPDGSMETLDAPTKRTSPSVHSLTSPSLDMPARMTTLSAGSGADRTASDEGMILLAQADEAITNESRPAESTGRRRTLTRREARPDFNLFNEHLSPEEDPLRQLVNIDFKDMDLANVVALLANKGQINVIAGTEISGSVTANLKEIPLGRAIEIVLRMNGLGIVEEAGVYRITSYEEAVSSRQDTEMIFLQTAEAAAVQETLEEITQNTGGSQKIRIGANTQSNIIVITGPRERVNELIEIVQELDVAEPIIPTVNRVIELNYADPDEIAEIIEPILSENGQVSPEQRAGQVIITDIPVKIEELSGLIAEIDVPEEQVSIEAMVVDRVVNDSANSGAGLLGIVDHIGDNFGPISLNTSNLLGTGSELGFDFVADNISITSVIAAEVQAGNAELLANPVVMTVENNNATIDIIDEIPYTTVERTDGEVIFTVEFKEVGTRLNVNPKVTFDRRIITQVEAEQSTVSSFLVTAGGETPVVATRKSTTTMRMNNGQTVYIAGLRRYDAVDDDVKTPVLGDIPIVGLFFKNQSRQKRNTELLVFLTCNIVDDDFPELTPYQKENYDRLGGITPEDDMNVTREILKGYYDEPLRDPIYKWRRPKK